MAEILGTANRDVLNGDTDPLNLGDFIFGLAGDDSLQGGNGSDLLNGGEGDDLLSGGAELDYMGAISILAATPVVLPESGDDLLDGGSGSDALSGGDGNDQIFGGEDDDFMGEFTLNVSSAGATVLGADAGNDRYDGGVGADFIAGGTGNDGGTGGEGNDYIGETNFNLSITTPTETVTIRAITTDLDNDRYDGGEGDDNLSGGGGNDVLLGSNGNDLIGAYRLSFSVTLTTPAFSGTLAGAVSSTDLGDDVLDGGEGDDRIAGGAGNDRLFGGAGNDNLGEYAVSSDSIDLDLINSFTGISVPSFTFPPIKGTESGNDILNGGDGNDSLTGGRGNDSLLGGTGNDRLIGANPALGGRAGRGEIDRMTGGSEQDTFILGQGAVYYNDGRAQNAGLEDYAIIRDLRITQGDRIQLAGRRADYRIEASPLRGVRGSAILLQRNQTEPELIAIVQGTRLSNFQQGFLFV